MRKITTREFIFALTKLEYPRGKQSLFLQAHYKAPGKALTAKKLAKAANYRSWRAINLQYGLLAKKIVEQIGIKNGNLSYLVEFAGPKNITNAEWILFMNPEFAKALLKVGWVK
jgi:hypothetical protein